MVSYTTSFNALQLSYTSRLRKCYGKIVHTSSRASGGPAGCQHLYYTGTSTLKPFCKQVSISLCTVLDMYRNIPSTSMSDKELSLWDERGVDPCRGGGGFRECGFRECGWSSGRDWVTSDESVTENFFPAVGKVVPECRDIQLHSELWLLSQGKKLQMT